MGIRSGKERPLVLVEGIGLVKEFNIEELVTHPKKIFLIVILALSLELELGSI